MANFFQFKFGFGPSAPGFRFTVKTDNTGDSNNDQFTIPLYTGETYDFTVAYDGQETAHNTDSDLTLTFPSGAGTYDIVITGTFPSVNFYNSGDALKLTEVSSFGTSFRRLGAAFFGCSNCLSFCCAIPYHPDITSLTQTWYDCDSATILPDVNALTNVTSLYETWWQCTSATIFPDVSALTNVGSLFRTWRGCNSCNTVPVLPSASTALTNCQGAFQFIGSGMTGTVVELWNTSNFPNIVNYTNCFTGCTGLDNYDDIPNDWKGL